MTQLPRKRQFHPGAAAAERQRPEQIGPDYTAPSQQREPSREPRPVHPLNLTGTRYTGTATAATHVQGHSSRIHLEDVPRLSDAEEEDQFYTTRSRTSVTPYQQPSLPRQPNRYDIEERFELLPSVRPRRSAVQQERTTESPSVGTPAKQRHGWRRPHWALLFGAGMTVMIGLVIGFVLVSSWWQTQQDDWHYGRPRTFQIDAVVGHNDSPQHPSHFIALNLLNHIGEPEIEIIEAPGGDWSKAKIYFGPTLYGANAILAPVTLSFEDIEGNGHPEMLVQFQGSEIIYLNEKINGLWTFVPQH